MKTALYIRVSTQEQAAEGYSVEAQIDHLRGYCRLNNIEDYEEYIDGGYSGSNLDRPGMQRMITDIERGLIERVVIYKLDRLSRKTKDTLHLVEDVFHEHKVKFVSLTDNIDTSTSSGKFFISILSSVAQLERENIKERSNLGRVKKAQKGLPSKGHWYPPGYDWDENNETLKINEEDAETVRGIFRDFLAGRSVYSITKKTGINNRTVYRILKNETYTGKVKFAGVFYESDRVPILIPAEDFDRVQLLLFHGKTKGRQLNDPKYFLTSFLFCGHCGARLAAHPSHGRVYYICYSQYKSMPHMIKDPNCPAKYCNAETYDQFVDHTVRKFLLDDSFREQVIVEHKEDQSASELKALHAALAEVNEKMKRLVDLYINMNLDKDTFTAKNRELKLQKTHIELEIKKRKKTVGIDLSPDDTVKELFAKYDNGDLKAKREVLRSLIDRIIITEETIQFIWNFV